MKTKKQNTRRITPLAELSVYMALGTSPQPRGLAECVSLWETARAVLTIGIIPKLISIRGRLVGTLRGFHIDRGGWGNLPPTLRRAESSNLFLLLAGRCCGP